MGSGETTFLQSGGWIIVLIVLAAAAAAIIAASYLMVSRWRQKSQTDLKLLRGELRRLQSLRRQAELAIQRHSPDDPEPFGSRAASLAAQLEESSQKINDLEKQLVSLQERTRQSAISRWKYYFKAPWIWYNLRKDISALQGAVAESEDLLVAARAMEQHITNIGWHVAQQTREVEQLQQRVQFSLGQLQTQNIQGDTIEEAANQAQQLKEVISQFPAFFLTGDEAAVLEQADKGSITQVHETLEDIQPRLEHLLSQVQEWERMYAATRDKVGLMQQTLTVVEEALEDMPEELAIAPQRTQFQGLQLIAQNLQAASGRMEIESMGMVNSEASRVTKTAREIGSEAKRASEDLVALQIAIGDLHKGLKELPLQMAALGARSAYPIAWSESTNALTALVNQANQVGTTQKPRDPEQIKQDLELARQLNNERIELARRCQGLEGQHNELMLLLGSPDLQQVNQWLPVARQTALDVQTYAAENWARGDATGSLVAEIDALINDGKRLIPATKTTTIAETELATRVRETREFADKIHALRERIAKVGTRLAEIQNIEKQAKEQVRDSQASLGQIIFVVRSNEFLTQIAEQETNRLQAALNEQIGALDQRHHGNVEKKARQAIALANRFEQIANQWLDQLGQDTAARLEDLSASLTQLDDIGPLDEAAVAEARRLLSSRGVYNAGGYTGKSKLPVDALVPEFKRSSDYWQTCTATHHALQDVEEPVVASYEQASHDRQMARERYAEASNLLRQKRSWPPVSISLEDELQELEKLEAQWQSVKNVRTKAIQVVAQLGSLSAKYQTLTEKINQRVANAEAERTQVEEIEAEIAEMAQIWQNQWYAYRENPNASEEIQELLASIDDELNQIKRQYQQGIKNHNQVLQVLKALHRRVRYYQVALDADHSIDSDGNLRRRR